MATRKPSVRHPSHNHPLRSHKVHADKDITCYGCDLDLIGEAFKCTKSKCDYFLHKSCFELPREILHDSHPDHPLTLHYSSPYESLLWKCDACDEYISGFTYHCSMCKYDLHVGCVSLPKSLERKEHEHPLKLLYTAPHSSGLNICSVCNVIVPAKRWSYYCKECDYATHIHTCAVEEEEIEVEVIEEEPERGVRIYESSKGYAFL